MKLPNSSTARHGAVDPRLLLGGGLLLALLITWVLLSGSDAVPTDSDGLPNADGTPEDDRPQAGTLEILQGRPLPGVGPLMIELHYLGSRDDTLITVQRPGVLFGTILGADGKGAEGVALVVQGGPQDGLTTFSGVDGAYRLEGLIPGIHFLRMQSRTIPAAVRMQRVLGQRDTRRNFFLGATVSVTLRIRDHKNKVLEGALVRSDLGLRSGITNEKGLVQLDGVPGGRRVVLDIRAAGHVPVRYEMNLFAGLLSGNPIDLPPLPIGGKVRGRVKSWPGGPLPTVTMVPRATRLGAFQVVWEEWQGVSTDREGRYVLENVPITHLLDVRAFHPQGVCDPRMRAVQPSISAAASADFVIRQAHATVSGKVVDTTGRPIAGAALRLEAVHPDRVLAALYPGLGDSPVGVRLPVPAQLLREGRTNRLGEFEFALGDHPQGTGHLLLTVEVKGKRSARREVKTVGKEFRIVMEEIGKRAVLRLLRSDHGPIPQTEVFLEGVLRDSLGGLEEGFYRVVVRRGDLVLKLVEQLWIQGETGLDLRR